jgi:long-chain fatty acid transport protein
MQTCGSAARKLAVRSLVVILSLAHGPVRPAGFAVDFVGARSVGTATAGSALAADASTIFFNPAGIVHLKRDEWIAGGDLFLLRDRFSNQGSTILGGAAPTPGDNGQEAIPTTPVPWIFGVHRINSALAVGIGIFSPFGLKTDYGTDFVGRYQNVLTSLKVIDVNPVVAYAPTSWLSVGAGVNIEYARLRLTQSIDFGSVCAAVLGAAPCAAGFGLAPGASDGGTELKADDVSVGFNVGVLLKPAESSRFSVNFRSRVTHEFGSARQSFDVPPGARAFLTAGGMPTAFTGGNARTSLPLPARLSFGWNQAINKNLNVMADATLTMWHVFRTTVVTPDDPTTGAAAFIEQRYEDAWRFALGADYVLNDRWTVRGGIAYDQTPIPAAFVQAALPDRDRVYLSAGTSYVLKEGWMKDSLSFDVGYSYVHYVGRIPINRSGPTGDTLKGEFAVGGHVLAAQLKYQY